MVAIAGCFAQAVTTGTGPVDNLFYHLSDPGHHNIFS
jgi:light-harvesting complex I chlorophyll a/b binding protein 2